MTQLLESSHLGLISMIQTSSLYGTNQSPTGEVDTEKERTYDKTPEANNDFLFHLTTTRINDERSFEYSGMYNNTRLVMDTSGQLHCQIWHDESHSWSLVWFQPRDRCSLYAGCGPYGICNNHNTPKCECMPGFEPASPEKWNSGNWPDGCVRKAQLRCGNKGEFLSMGRIKIPDGDLSVVASSAEECRDQCVSNCSCTAYAYANIVMMMMTNGDAPTCLVWFGRLMDAGNLMIEDSDAGAWDLFIRITASELSSDQKRPLSVIFILSFVIGALLLGAMIYFLKMMLMKKGNTKKMLKTLMFSSHAANTYDKLDPNQIGEDIPVFKFESIAMATRNCSNSNTLGQGGFGAVYKGTLLGGQEIVMKRLANNSGPGLEEFTNEVILIAKLQHRNLVRLLGCCIEADEKLLVYEYMPNKSVDFFLFDQNQSMLLDWERTFNIILGIARGLLYLHQDSRLRIIHRDMKAGNILLDKDMNPKISDFGIARIFGGNQTQANTRRVMGT